MSLAGLEDGVEEVWVEGELGGLLFIGGREDHRGCNHSGEQLRRGSDLADDLQMSAASGWSDGSIQWLSSVNFG